MSSTPPPVEVVQFESSHAADSWTVATVAVLALALILRLLCYNGPIGSDDVRYFHFAEKILRDHGLSELDHAASRLVFLVLAGFPGVLGGNMFFSVFANILYASLTDLLVTMFVRREFGAKAGFVAASYVGLAGTTLVYASTMLPDTLLGLFMVASGILVYRGGIAHGHSVFLGAGILLGIAYSIKDTGVLLIPPVLFYVVFVVDRMPLAARINAVAFYLLGFLLAWLAESLVYFALSGDFFYKIRSIQEVHNASAAPAESLYAFARAGWLNATEIVTRWDYLLIPLALAILVWIYTLFRNRRLSLFALSGLFICVYLIAGTSSVSRLISLPFQERYIQPVLPFAAISLGYAVNNIRTARPQLGIIVAGAVALFAIGCKGAIHRSGTLYFTEALRTAAIAVQSLPRNSEPVFVDLRLYRGLRHVLPDDDFERVRLFENTQPTLSGYYLSFRAKDGASQSEWSAYVEAHRGAVVRTFELEQRIAKRYYPRRNNSKFVIEISRHGVDQPDSGATR